MKLGRMAHKLRLSSDSLILLKSGTAIAEPEHINNLVATIEKTNLSNIILMVVDDFDDIRVMDEKSMNAHGWFRVGAIQKLLHVPPAKPNGEEEKGEDVEIDI